MKRFLGVLAVTTLFASVAADSAQAQRIDNARPVTIGLAAGLSMPTGDFGDSFKSGYNITGSLGFRPAAVPFGLRAEVGYESHDVDSPADFSLSTLYGTLNGVFDIGSGATGMAPYLIAGLGMYRFSGDDMDSMTDFGINGGGGVKFALSGFTTFVEARYHHVFSEDDALTFIPITFGVQF